MLEKIAWEGFEDGGRMSKKRRMGERKPQNCGGRLWPYSSDDDFEMTGPQPTEQDIAGCNDLHTERQKVVWRMGLMRA